jgi:hypothetical protein
MLIDGLRSELFLVYKYIYIIEFKFNTQHIIVSHSTPNLQQSGTHLSTFYFFLIMSIKKLNKLCMMHYYLVIFDIQYN